MPVVAQPKPDLDPLAEVLAGDPAAIRAFYRQYGPLLLEVIRRVLHRHGRANEAEDCLQTLFLEIFADNARLLRKWRPELGRLLRTYLSVLANYRSRSWLRRRIPLSLTDNELQRLIDAPYEFMAVQDEQLGLDELVAQIQRQCSAEDWQLFVHCFLEDRHPEELAQQLGMSVAAIYQRKRRLRLRLQELYYEEQNR